MVKGVKIYEVGGPEVLKWEDIEVGEPGDGEVRVKQNAIGLNFIDVYFRKGAYKTDTPFIPGMEAAGVVTAVGPGLTGRKVGDRVAYAGSLGAYTEERIIPAHKLVTIPKDIDDVTAAAIILKGMTAQVLLRKCFKVEPGHKILVHAAAGGVGSLLVQWASSIGATVIAAVSNKEKAAQAKEDGAHHVIIYSEENFVEKVKEVTSGAGVQVVYDSVGKDTLQGSLECLAIRGYLVSFGQSSGPPDPVPTSALATRSLFMTRPHFFIMSWPGMIFSQQQGRSLRQWQRAYSRFGRTRLTFFQTQPKHMRIWRVARPQDHLFLYLRAWSPSRFENNKVVQQTTM